MPWFPVRVTAVSDESPIDRSLVIEAVDPADRAQLRWLPGQFLLLRDQASGIPGQRAYSLSVADQADGRAVITVRDMGRFGAHLFRRAVGDGLEAQAPRGRFVMTWTDADRLLLIAAGSGVAPFRAFVQAWRAAGAKRSLVLVQSAQQAAELIFRTTFEAEARRDPGLRYMPTVTRAADQDPWAGRRGRIDDALIASCITAASRTRVFVCGPTPFVKDALGLAAAQGVPATHRHHEAWG